MPNDLTRGRAITPRPQQQFKPQSPVRRPTVVAQATSVPAPVPRVVVERMNQQAAHPVVMREAPVGGRGGVLTKSRAPLPHLDRDVMRGAVQRSHKKAALLNASQNLPVLKEFDPHAQYRVRVTEPVKVMPDGSHWLRPNCDCVVSGAFVMANLEFISGAEKL